MDHPASSRLLALSPIDSREDIDERIDRYYTSLNSIISSIASETEAHDALMNFVCKSPAAHEDACAGLVVSILIDTNNSIRFFKDLSFVNRDGMTVVVSFLNQLVVERFWKLQESCRQQLIWLVREMMKASINNVDNVVFNILRNISGGDISPRNISLAESMVDLMIDQKEWLYKNQFCTATVVYTFLRLIIDHHNFANLRSKEVHLCVTLLRERFSDCMIIGRDLVRLLQNVSRIPDFESLWRDLLTAPLSLSPSFTGILQLLQTRTSRRFLQCRLTPDMERKVVFLTSQVKFGQQKRYQDWFQKQYLSTPESQSLRCDLIRFICGVIHPSNEVLCSDIIPRWAVIGWILSSCTSNVAAANAKLSLFYDWLFYDPERDNIMNIEPAILVMFHSIRSHPVISVTLLDFLCRIIPNFCPSLTTHVRKGVCTSLQQILDKRVLASLTPLFEGSRLDAELRALIKQTFPEFCSGRPTEPPAVEVVMRQESVTRPTANNNSNESRFSDDEASQDESPKKITESLNNGQHQERPLNSFPTKAEVTLHLDQLSDNLKKTVETLMAEKDSETRCEVMENLIQAVLQDPEFDGDMSASLSLVLCSALSEELSRKVLPNNPDDESLEDSIGSAFFVLLRNLVEPPEEDPSRPILAALLADLSSQVSCVGYSLLYFLKVCKSSDVSAYKEFAKIAAKDLPSCLLSDLKSCQEEDVNMFCFILPDVYRNFESTVLSNPQFLHLTVSCIDSIQLQDLICHILRGDMKMLKKENVVQIINASLEWETFEQTFVWQLISAHNISLESILPVLPKLEYLQHSEALTGILLSLRKQEPTADLLRHVLERDVRADDFFVVSILHNWTRHHESKTAELISAHIKNSCTPAKRKRSNSPKGPTLSSTAEHALAHLNQLRQQTRNSTSFFNHESIQTALISIQETCTDAQKTRFSDLFALADEVETKHPSKKKSKSSAASKKKANKVDSNSDTEGSEEETPVPSKSSKGSSAASSRSKKSRKNVVNDDSD